MNLNKRISELESVTIHKEGLRGLGEYYEWEKTPEGKAELDKFYCTEKEAKKMMDNYHKNLRERGLL